MKCYYWIKNDSYEALSSTWWESQSVSSNGLIQKGIQWEFPYSKHGIRRLIKRKELVFFEGIRGWVGWSSEKHWCVKEKQNWLSRSVAISSRNCWTRRSKWFWPGSICSLAELRLQYRDCNDRVNNWGEAYFWRPTWNEWRAAILGRVWHNIWFPAPYFRSIYSSKLEVCRQFTPPHFLFITN